MVADVQRGRCTYYGLLCLLMYGVLAVSTIYYGGLKAQLHIAQGKRSGTLGKIRTRAISSAL